MSEAALLAWKVIEVIEGGDEPEQFRVEFLQRWTEDEDGARIAMDEYKASFYQRKPAKFDDVRMSVWALIEAGPSAPTCHDAHTKLLTVLNRRAPPQLRLVKPS